MNLPTGQPSKKMFWSSMEKKGEGYPILLWKYVLNEFRSFNFQTFPKPVSSELRTKKKINYESAYHHFSYYLTTLQF